jgi:hypothetical protein
MVGMNEDVEYEKTTLHLGERQIDRDRMYYNIITARDSIIIQSSSNVERKARSNDETI